MLVMLILWVLMMVRQPGIVKDAFHSLFSKQDRSYSDSANDLLSEILLILFRSTTLTMLVYILVFCGAAQFRILYFLALLGLVILFDLCKWMILRLLSYVFSLQRRMDGPRAVYNNLWVFSAVLLFPVMVVIVNTGWTVVGWGFFLGIMGVYLGLLIRKMFRMFSITPMGILYILLYTMTLEVLPIGALVLISQTYVN